MNKAVVTFTALLAAASITACAPETDAPIPSQAPSAPSATVEPSAPSEAATEAPVDPANPVVKLRALEKCKLDDGAVSGEWTMDGLNKYATCNYRNNGGGLGAEVTVYTSAPGADPVLSAAPEGIHPDDGTAYIVGDDFLAVLSQVPGGYDYHVAPEDVASALGGAVVTEDTAPAKKATPSAPSAPDPAHDDVDAAEEAEGALVYDTDGDPAAEEFTPDYEGKSSAELQAEWNDSASDGE